MTGRRFLAAVGGVLGLGLVALVGLIWWVGPCPTCGGTGSDPDGPTRCPDCEGTGW